MLRRPPRSTLTEHSFPTRRSSDLLGLVVPIHPDEGSVPVENALAATATDEVALVCVHEVTAESLKWAHELATWRWIRDNCEELRVDDLARAEVSERLASAEEIGRASCGERVCPYV